MDTLETLRHLYNNALAERIDAYRHEGRTVGYLEQQNQLPLLKKKALPLSAVYAQVAQECLRRLDRAYLQFFRRIKAGETPGFPRFKGSGQYSSLTYPHYTSGVKLEGELLHLSKIGDIPVRVHRPLQGTPKTCTITRKADGWYASIACDVEPHPLLPTEQEVGIDVGIENFATLTDEHAPIANPRHLQQAQAQLKKAQRRLERRTKRDRNRKLLAKQSKRREQERR